MERGIGSSPACPDLVCEDRLKNKKQDFELVESRGIGQRAWGMQDREEVYELETFYEG